MIYIVTTESFPFGYAATNRILCYSQALKNKNISCKILVYKRRTIPGCENASGVYNGIDYCYVGGKCQRSRNRILARFFDVLDRLMLLVYLYRYVKKNDVVLGYTMRSFCSFIVMMTHLKKGKYVAELCEFPYQDSNKSKLRRKIGTWFLFAFVFPKFDGIIVISEALKQIALKNKKEQCRLVKIPILVDLKRFKEYSTNNQINCKLSTINLVHAGAKTEKKDGVLGMIEAFGIASKTVQLPMRFYFTGYVYNSPHKEEILNLIEKYDLKGKIIFTGYLSENDLKKLIYNASFFIINKYPTTQNLYCFATKLGEYMAIGKPVIITKCGEAVNWLSHKENAYFVEPCVLEQLVSAIVELSINNELRIEIGKNARKKCEESFSFDVYSDVLSCFFGSLRNL